MAALSTKPLWGVHTCNRCKVVQVFNPVFPQVCATGGEYLCDSCGEGQTDCPDHGGDADISEDDWENPLPRLFGMSFHLKKSDEAVPIEGEDLFVPFLIP